MENLSFKGIGFFGIIHDWGISCHNKTLKINNNGIKLGARNDEGLKRISFDIEKKTIEVSVENPTLPPHICRVIDLSSDVTFFEEIRANMEKILLAGSYSSIVPNEDRTIFEIS